ncbi:MAG: secondary thiamine-phosphate synthase enzyme YjbQ [Xanthomonadaceae bacterium]|nr:secondary thiamine-phosphate synthase enzyme YjbQ [Xanthomonadaceae bacterium]
MHRETLETETPGRGFSEITGAVNRVIRKSGIADGLCHLFILHTSASMIVTENADPEVLRDLDMFIGGLVRDGDPRFVHTAEGIDDMSAHVRSILTQTSLTIPVTGRGLLLGTWQGVFIWEHRTRPHARRVIVTVADAGHG